MKRLAWRREDAFGQNVYRATSGSTQLMIQEWGPTNYQAWVKRGDAPVVKLGKATSLADAKDEVGHWLYAHGASAPRRRRRHARSNPTSTGWLVYGVSAVTALGLGAYAMSKFTVLPCFSFTPEDQMTPEQKAKCEQEKADSNASNLALIGAVSAAGFGAGAALGSSRGHMLLGGAIGAASLWAILYGARAIRKASAAPQGPVT